MIGADAVVSGEAVGIAMRGKVRFGVFEALHGGVEVGAGDVEAVRVARRGVAGERREGVGGCHVSVLSVRVSAYIPLNICGEKRGARGRLPNGPKYPTIEAHCPLSRPRLDFGTPPLRTAGEST